MLLLPYLLLGYPYDLREKVQDHLDLTIDNMKKTENQEIKTFLLGQFCAYRIVLQEIEILEDLKCGE